jgi:hypothetical protein
MKQPLTSTKITPEGLRLLQQIALRLGEKQYGTLMRLLAREWDRVQKLDRERNAS